MQPKDSAPEALPAQHIKTLYEMLGGYRVSQAIFAAVRLGIPDLLAAGPQTSDALAQQTGTQPGPLFRLLRFLAGIDLVTETAPRQFALTELGQGLRQDVPGSMAPNFLLHMEPAKWQAWTGLIYSLETGAGAFAQMHGIGFFDYLAQHPTAVGDFQRAMTANTARSGTAITQVYDFAGIDCLVDVGGGQGLLLATILQAHPVMRGILFDRPGLVGAEETLAAAGVLERCEIISGDFFAAVPSGGDAYVLRHILHDWDDAHALQILQSCRHAMPDTGKVLVIERAIATDPHQAMPTLQLDLDMLVTFGGAERSAEEYRALFAAADLRMTREIPLGDVVEFSLYEAVAA